MVILIDMDGPLADFELGLFRSWVKKYPKRPAIHPNERDVFWCATQYNNLGLEFGKDTTSIVDTPGFFAGLPVVCGSQNGISCLGKAGHKVVVCTTPRPNLPHSIEEKRLWLLKNFGERISRQAIMAQDKTLVHGDFLIDDNPEIKGENLNPSWRQILWDMPFNKKTPIPRAKSWGHVLEIFTPGNSIR